MALLAFSVSFSKAGPIQNKIIRYFLVPSPRIKKRIGRNWRFMFQNFDYFFRDCSKNKEYARVEKSKNANILPQATMSSKKRIR